MLIIYTLFIPILQRYNIFVKREKIFYYELHEFAQINAVRHYLSVKINKTTIVLHTVGMQPSRINIILFVFILIVCEELHSYGMQGKGVENIFLPNNTFLTECLKNEILQKQKIKCYLYTYLKGCRRCFLGQDIGNLQRKKTKKIIFKKMFRNCFFYLKKSCIFAK